MFLELQIGILVILFPTFHAYNEDPAIVSFPNCNQKLLGNIKYSSYDQKTIWEFLSIPYARPPVGVRRFQKPELLSVEENGPVIDATKRRSICMQRYSRIPYLNDWVVKNNISVSEDCLTLNIWMPKRMKRYDPNNYWSSLFPVMVWIHGGGFQLGSAHEPSYDGVTFSGMANVVLVSINYRLNLFGFLYSGNDEAEGNMGLLDQQVALSWINRYISYFDGDKNRVTVFGESAGAASIHYMMLMKQPLLFHRAIMQSGTAAIPAVSNDKAYLKNLTIWLAHETNCITEYGTEITPDVMQCLKNLPATTLMDKNPTGLGFMQFGFIPLVDGCVIPDEPTTSLGRNGHEKIPVIIGSTTNEAAFFMQINYRDKFGNLANANPIETLDDVKFYLNLTVPNRYRNKFSDFIERIAQMYNPVLENPSIDVSGMSMGEALIRAVSDIHITCDVQNWAILHAKSGSLTYNYVFAHGKDESADWARAPHTGELAFLFALPYDQEKRSRYTDVDRRISKGMIELWAHFAHDLNFTENTWLPFDKNGNYYEFKAYYPSNVPKNFEKTSCDFLKTLIGGSTRKLRRRRY